MWTSLCSVALHWRSLGAILMFELTQIRNPKLLRMGVMTASLKEGTLPELSEEFKMIVTEKNGGLNSQG